MEKCPREWFDEKAAALCESRRKAARQGAEVSYESSCLHDFLLDASYEAVE
ncbi:MAG: hypothetical protein HOP19_11765 [Acidobacteria bacterium]|nr:hypothetical protein [Acidobacteriota bacterium]